MALQLLSMCLLKQLTDRLQSQSISSVENLCVSVRKLQLNALRNSAIYDAAAKLLISNYSLPCN